MQVRYNPPELLADYLRSKQEEGRGAGRDEGRGTGRGRRESVRSEASSGPSSEAATEAAEETAEDIIFTLFGPRVWEHEGEHASTSLGVSDGDLNFYIDTVTDTQYSDIRRGAYYRCQKGTVLLT